MRSLYSTYLLHPIFVAGRAATGYFFLPWRRAIGAASLLLALTGCDNSPSTADRDTNAARRPAITACAADSVSAPPAPLTDAFDTSTVGGFFGERRLLRPYRRDAQEFYAGRAGRIAWFRPDGKLRPQAYKLLSRIQEAEKDGLDPTRYRLAALKRQIAAAAPDSLARLAALDSVAPLLRKRSLDLHLTGAYFQLLGEHALGAVDAGVNGAKKWSERRKYIHLARSLTATLAARDTSARTYDFGTRHPEYDRLRAALIAHRALAKTGGWPLVPLLKKGEPALQPGTRDSVWVPVLRRRLAADAALAAAVRAAGGPGAVTVADSVAIVRAVAAVPDSVTRAETVAQADPAVYDSALVRQVAAFQGRMGLKADGVIGAGTLGMLRAPVSEAIRRIQLNMERWRWVPRKQPGRYMLVNIPEFQLHVVGANGRNELTMRVIVGNKQKNTPIFADELKFIVLAPYWNLPPSIVVDEIRPAQLRNKNYIAGEDMEVVNRKNQVVPADKVDWKGVSLGNWTPYSSYRLRQRAGGKNPLGPIKFIFPNDQDVYLHGTANQWLFEKEVRGFSHGCVRVEDPYRLATYLLQDQPDWNDTRLREGVAAGKETWVVLKKRLPVYLLYLTAWADADGAMHYRPDIYGHDRTLGRALGR